MMSDETEALGYLLAQRELGMTPTQANALTFLKRLDIVANRLRGVLPFVVPGWSKGAADNYNAIKHANRTLPEAVDLANCWRECVLVFRGWIALELDVDTITLVSRLSGDSCATPTSTVRPCNVRLSVDNA